MTTDNSGKMTTTTSSSTDIEKNDLITSQEAIIVEEEPVEPTHTFCTRLMCFPASIIAFIPAAGNTYYDSKYNNHWIMIL